jgi:hypothetical protein
VAWRSTFPPEHAFRARCGNDDPPRAIAYDSQAFTLLKTLFPSWVTLSDAVGPCVVCDTLAETSREDKRELRKKAEEEKVDLYVFVVTNIIF